MASVEGHISDRAVSPIYRLSFHFVILFIVFEIDKENSIEGYCLQQSTVHAVVSTPSD